MSSILNVLANASGPMVVDAKEFDEAISRGVSEAQAVNAINNKNREDIGWRDELADLSRRLNGLPSVEEAQARVDNLMSAVASQTKALNAQIAECKAAQKTAFLSRAEQTQLARRVAAIEEQLSDFIRGTRVPLAQAEGLLADAKTWNPLRPRLEELRKRAKAIDSALKV